MDQYWILKKVLPNKKNHEVVGEFLLNLKLANRSHHTINLYRKFLERFFGEVEEEFSSLSSDTIHQWYLTNEAKGSEATLHVRLSVLASFYTFCVQEEYLVSSPMKSRWFPRLPKPVPKYVEREDVAKVRKTCESFPLRDQVIVEFLLASGCRVGELYTLNKEDINLENRSAKVVGKGKKIRQVHFTERCAVLLERYMKSSCPSIPALFVSDRKRRLSIPSIRRIVSGIGKKAELTTLLGPHRLRHTFATELLAKGAELSFIKEELGHSDLGTTQIYARLPKREVVALYRKYMG